MPRRCAASRPAAQVTPHWRTAILELPTEERLAAALDMLSDVLGDDAALRDHWCGALGIWPGVLVLLCALLARPGIIVQTNTIAIALEAQGSEGTPERLIPVYIHHLRQAMKPLDLAAAIRTHRGIGWSITPDATTKLKRRFPFPNRHL